MNQGKIWLVVNPTVGLPAFLGGVATISLCVHAAVLNKTDWYPAIYNGKAKAKVAQVEEAAKPVAKAPTALQPAAADASTTVAAVSTASTGKAP